MNINSLESPRCSQSTLSNSDSPREKSPRNDNPQDGELASKKHVVLSLKNAIRNLSPLNREIIMQRDVTLKNISPLSRDNIIRKEILEYRQIKHTKNKRVDVIIELRKVYDCLINVFNDKNNKITLTQSGLLKVTLNKNLNNNLEINQEVIKFIYHKILRGMTTHIDYFFDDRGYFVTLKEMDKLAIKIFPDFQSPFQIDVEDELKNYYEDKPMFLWVKNIVGESEYLDLISHLPFPKLLENQNFSNNEKLCISIFQRLYPSRGPKNITNEEVPLMSPITFLYSYKNYLTTTELFNQALLVLNLPEEEMPHLQKLRVLNFLRVGIDSHLIQNEDITNSVKAVINKIVLMQTVKNQEFRDLCQEIQFLSEQMELDNLIEKLEIPSDAVYPVDKFLSIEASKTISHIDFINALTDDIKHMASQAFFNVTLSSLFKEKGGNKTEIFYQGLMNFIANYFIKSFELRFDNYLDTHLIKNKLDHFFEIFIDVAYELVKKHDYLSSFAIYNLLNVSIFSKLLTTVIEKTDKNTFTKMKKNNISKGLETATKLQELDELFSFKNNLEMLRKKMKECQALHIYYIPLLGPIKNVLLHRVEMIEQTFTDDSKINNSKLHMIAEEAWEVNKFLQDVKGHFKIQKVALKTDLNTYLELNLSYNEEKLDEIYKTLNPYLTRCRQTTS